MWAGYGSGVAYIARFPIRSTSYSSSFQLPDFHYSYEPRFLLSLYNTLILFPISSCLPPSTFSSSVKFYLRVFSTRGFLSPSCQATFSYQVKPHFLLSTLLSFPLFQCLHHSTFSSFIGLMYNSVRFCMELTFSTPVVFVIVLSAVHITLFCTNQVFIPVLLLGFLWRYTFSSTLFFLCVPSNVLITLLSLL